MELVEMKNISKIKNTLKEICNRLDSAEEKNGELENMAMDAIPNEQHIEKKRLKQVNRASVNVGQYQIVQHT